MHKLRVIAATLAAALCALGLSVGAALAEDHQGSSPAFKDGKSDAKNVCILHDLVP
jgi:hypothetical protein